MTTTPLADSTVAVLGGTSGIGLATALAAAEAGAHVHVVSSRESSVSRALAALPETAHGSLADLSSPDAVRSALDAIGTIDHLVFTAGEPLTIMPVLEMDLGRAHAFFELRFFSALAAVQAALPHLRDGGSITLTTGTAFHRPGAGWSVAAGITGAVIGTTRALAVELGPRLRVNAVSPGFVRSPLWDSMPDADREAMYAAAGAAAPLGRVAEVADVAAAYLYCMTQHFATGTVLTVDGGSLLV
ncbi:MAG: hypothetical protein QOK11_1723 [Pseudonocardiales bacterium]|jgi:NAD(P)-dependent dehydrogenase (short-subunit alcohol dehydrogenase family)|nr:hypothetical protein [Pseudonocardiales bacterium]MDT4946368.1 hypothetical protein [Pseudonocardiales bacterium]